ncbi:MAG: DUF302 domain-containing protein [Candidatus Thermoplasmatota archaeon]|nr:DUF302 domain-containing protein [Candidatus Thermoplasmatota archaeon]
MEMNAKEITSELGFEETVAQLKRSIEDNGLKVVSEINAQENLKRIGVHIEGNRILEVFNPKLASEVFSSDIRAGIVPPLRIYIYQYQGKTHVSVQSAAEMFAGYKGLEELAIRVDSILESVIRNAGLIA